MDISNIDTDSIDFEKYLEDERIVIVLFLILLVLILLIVTVNNGILISNSDMNIIILENENGFNINVNNAENVESIIVEHNNQKDIYNTTDVINYEESGVYKIYYITENNKLYKYTEYNNINLEENENYV